MNKYLAGARILASRPRDQNVIGANWWQIFYNPAGIAYDYYNTGQAHGFSGGAAANPYWAQQHATMATNPLATGNAARIQAAQALQAQLRAQQMAAIQA